ncbi:MAG TPA: hypothetical protein VJ032_13550, partial [Thermoanaerobaculia bacterium]|nr:hypothetical protein [Thermoanaerobaculia bacterium]
VPRNSLEAAGFASLDVRVSRDVEFASGGTGDRALTFGVDAFNLTNKVNCANFVGTRGSPLFLQPISARSPRQLQFSARFTF